MSNSVSTAFVKQYEREVHTAYQRMGSKLRGTVRTVTGVDGSSTTFQKVGKGIAGTKDRHGLVPVMNVDHTVVECILYDYYAGDWVDKLDELKTNVDERKVVSDAGAYALGRKTDDLILNELLSASTSIPVGTSHTTPAKVLAGIAALGARDVVMDDGEIYFLCGWPEWTNLMTYATFASADYVPREELPWAGKGMVAKRWSGVMVMPSSLIGADGNNVSTGVMWHSSAVGHAIGLEVTADITWHGDRAAHFVNHMMSQGAELIDDNGVIKIVGDRDL